MVTGDGEVYENVILSSASSKKIGITVDGENFERVFDVKEVTIE